MGENGWIKLYRRCNSNSDTFDRFATETGHRAWYLLTGVIAHRARRKPGTEKRTQEPLAVGEALLGDHSEYGMSRGQYRAALFFLKKTGMVTTRATTRGSIVLLTSSGICDINQSTSDMKTTNKPPSNNLHTTTNKKVEGSGSAEGSSSCESESKNPDEEDYIQFELAGAQFPESMRRAISERLKNQGGLSSADLQKLKRHRMKEKKQGGQKHGKRADENQKQQNQESTCADFVGATSLRVKICGRDRAPWEKDPPAGMSET